MRLRQLHVTLALPLLVFSCNRTPPEVLTTPDPGPSPTRDAGAAAAPAGGGQRAEAPRPEARPAAPSGSGLTRPTVEIPPGPAPSTLQSTDLVTGTGPEARTGQHVDVQYTGVAWSTHREFDSSWGRGGPPFSFVLGQGQVIRGWDQGVAGMRVGGRRRLVIPPALGYGERGAGANIGPNETLVFVVDLVGVH